MNRLQEAMSAVRTNPKSSTAWSDLGHALLEEKQIEKAKQSYQRALQLDPMNEVAQEGIRMTLISKESVPSEPPLSAKAASPKPTAKASEAKVEPELEFESEPEPEPKSEPKAKSQPVSRGTVPTEESEIESRFFDEEDYEEDDEEQITDKSIRFSGVSNKLSAEKEKKIVFRDPLPMPEKPSRTRLWMGIIFILLVGFLCVCSFIFAAYQLMP